MKIHEMRLLKEPYEEIKKGRKTVEMRLFDEKRREIRIGDGISFSCEDFPGEKICVTVSDTYIYEDFLGLAESFSPESLGFPGKSAGYIAEYMERIYGAEKVKKYGAFALSIRLK